MKSLLAAVGIVCALGLAEPARAAAPRYDDYRVVLTAFLIDRAKGSVLVSEIFRWYADDFAPTDAPKKDRAARERGALLTAAGPYLNDADRSFLNDARIEYAPYDWSLNEQPR